MVQFEKEASHTRDFCVAKGATLRPPQHAKTGRAGDPGRAARPDPSLRKNRLLRMTSKLHHYPWFLRTNVPSSP